MSSKQAAALLYQAMMKLGPFTHVHRNIPKVACTTAGLKKGEFIKIEHISEAIQYRSLDRGL